MVQMRPFYLNSARVPALHQLSVCFVLNQKVSSTRIMIVGADENIARPALLEQPLLKRLLSNGYPMDFEVRLNRGPGLSVLVSNAVFQQELENYAFRTPRLQRSQGSSQHQGTA